MVLVSGIVLAGGRGRRMHTFKPALTLGGRPLIARAMAALRPLTDEIIVAHGLEAHRESLEPLVTQARLVRDEGEGPLTGLFRAAQAAHGEWVLVAPADAPFLSPELYGRLLEEAQDAEGCIPPGGTKANPLIGAYNREVLLWVSETMLRRGERAARSILPHLRLTRLRTKDLVGMPFGRHCTFDIDTKEDFTRATEILRGRGNSRKGPSKDQSA